MCGSEQIEFENRWKLHTRAHIGLSKKQNKYFQIETPSGEKQTVSIERLKPVKLRGANNNGSTGSKNTKRWTANDNTSGDTASQTQDTREEPTVTRSGRRVHFAKHNDHIYYT